MRVPLAALSAAPTAWNPHPAWTQPGRPRYLAFLVLLPILYSQFPSYFPT